MSRRGNSMIELVTVLAVMGIFAAIAVPTASGARAALAGRSAAQRLALVLRTAQARAQSVSARVDVTVHADGQYAVVEADSGEQVARGHLGAPVATNYPGGALSFAADGLPCLCATSTPRAGNFAFGSGAGRTVVVQLGGCVRCR